jgi:hypothetical protein
MSESFDAERRTRATIGRELAETGPEPWQQVGERRPLAGFIDSDFPGLPYEQAVALRSLELAERREEQARQEQLAERREASLNRAIMEAHRRAGIAGERWDPKDPWRHYPSHEQRVAEAFAALDANVAVEMRQARQAAAAVLREHGVFGQVTVDSGQPAPKPDLTSVPGQTPSPSGAAGIGPGPTGSGAATRGIPSAVDYREDRSARARAARALRRWSADGRAQARAAQRKEQWQ